MKKLLKFGEKTFVCELKEVIVRGGKTTEKVFCKEIKKQVN